MADTHENPFAFPFPEVRIDGCGIREGSDGMTLRDWFAGQALAICGALGSVRREAHETQAQADARYAYNRADAMLAERTRGQ